jgi:hypothetical protein
MSYSFSLRAADKSAAKAAVEAKFDEVIASQPVHVRDKAAVLANAGAVIDLLVDDDTKDVTVSCNGYVSWNSDQAALTGVAVTCSAGYANRE